MTCNDCPNQTDGKCCHQLIRPQGSKTMNVLDEAAWEREINHANRVQEQREGRDGKNPPKVFFASARMVWDRDAFAVTEKDDNQ